jgi:hypothetical protein
MTVSETDRSILTNYGLFPEQMVICCGAGALARESPPSKNTAVKSASRMFINHRQGIWGWPMVLGQDRSRAKQMGTTLAKVLIGGLYSLERRSQSRIHLIP